MAINMPERPTTAKTYKDAAYFEENFPDDAQKVINDMTKTMMANKNNTISTNHWALDAFSNYHWRLPQKNQLRDFPRFSLAAYFEEHFVAEYRQDLLNTSKVAAYLRSKLQLCLEPFGKLRQTIYQGNLVKSKLFLYPDNCTIPTSPKLPKIKIDKLIASNDQVAYISDARKAIRSLRKSLTSNCYAKLIPSGTKVNREVADCIALLVKVRHIPLSSLSFCCSYSHPYSLQALNKNAHVLQKMEASGLHASEIDPADEEFEVHSDDVRELMDSDVDAEGEDDPNAVANPVPAAVTAQMPHNTENIVPSPSHQNDMHAAEKEKSDNHIIADIPPHVNTIPNVTAQSSSIPENMDINSTHNDKPVECLGDAQNLVDQSNDVNDATHDHASHNPHGPAHLNTSPPSSPSTPTNHDGNDDSISIPIDNPFPSSVEPLANVVAKSKNKRTSPDTGRSPGAQQAFLVLSAFSHSLPRSSSSSSKSATI